MANVTLPVTNLSGRIGIVNVGAESSTYEENDNYATAIPIYLGECDVWSMPSRIALQVLLLVMILLNLAAAVVVFGVPVNVRGRHVAFLFICVRVLNILDLYQCGVLFFFPLGMPKDCQNPDMFYCNLSGFCFATGTILSPLVAIIMALDRLFAVFFHVRYKERPQIKTKCAILSGLMGLYIVYFTLPFYTDFGKYMAVSWLSLCSFEWGVEYRMFNLVLFTTTTCLTLILMAANAAIVIKVRRRKKEFERMKASSQNHTPKKGIKMTKLIPSRNGVKLWKSKSVNDLSLSSAASDRCAESPRSLHERRGKLLSPLRILFSSATSSPTKDRQPEHHTIPSEHCRNVERIKSKTKDDNIKNSSAVSRPFSPIPPSPLTHDCALLFPPSPLSARISWDGSRPPSPLVSENEMRTTSRIVTRRLISRSTSYGIERLSSTDSILDARETALSTFGHRTLDPNTLRKKALGNLNSDMRKRNASSEPFLDTSCNSSAHDQRQKSTSSNSLFSNFMGSRLMSWRQRASQPKGIRRNVSRITKMTTAICTLFAVLYIPFLVRKLVQIIPQDYNTVYIPPAVEIITLFGPLLSPLFNPILYVFFNPHYRENCKRLYRKLTKTATASRDFVDVSTTQGRPKSSRKNRKDKRKKTLDISESENLGSRAELKQGNEEVFVSTGHQHEDGVFVSDGSNSDSGCSMQVKDEDGRRQSLRQIHLRKIQNLQYRRTKSNDYLN